MDMQEKQKILQELGGITEDVYNELVDMFIDQTQSQIVDLKKILAEQDYENASKIGHSIKGAAANLRIYSVQEAASAIEKEAKENPDQQKLNKYLEGIEKNISFLKENK